MFRDATSFNSAISNINTGLVTDLCGVFYGASVFNKDITSWATNNATTMKNMFRQATAFDQNIVTSGNQWNVLKVTSMEGMFMGVPAAQTTFNQDIGNWLTSSTNQLTDMSGMFAHSKFDQDIGNWSVGNVTTMENTFRSSDFNQNISSWNVAAVTNMKGMLSAHNNTDGTTKFNQDIRGWKGKINSGLDATGMTLNNVRFNSTSTNWYGVVGLNRTTGTISPAFWSSYLTRPATFSSTADLSAAITWYIAAKTPATTHYGEIGTWDVSNLTDMSGLFAYRTTFNEDISGWNVSNVTDMSGMFRGATSFNQPLSLWGSKTSNVTDMTSMFEDATSFAKYVGSWNLGSVTKLDKMFKGATSFNSEVRRWSDLSTNTNAITFGDMFLNATAFNNNSTWSTNTNLGPPVSKAFWEQYAGTYTMSNTSLQTAVGLWITNRESALETYGSPKTWIVDSVTNMNGLFENKSPSAWGDFDLSGWNVNNVTTMKDFAKNSLILI